MGKLTTPRALLMSGVAAALLASGWGTGVSQAQEDPQCAEYDRPAAGPDAMGIALLCAAP